MRIAQTNPRFVQGRNAGVTLAELLIASAIAVVVILGLGIMDVMRVRVQEDLRKRSGVVSAPAQGETAAAMLLFSHELVGADRFNLLGLQPDCSPNCTSSNLQVRLPRPGVNFSNPIAFDNATNYRWDQYVLVGDQLRYYADVQQGCVVKVLASQITSLQFQYVNAESLVPLGGELPSSRFAASPADPNVLKYTVTWTSGDRSQTFVDEITARAMAYSDVNAGAGGRPGDSGTGLAPITVSNPPSSCI